LHAFKKRSPRSICPRRWHAGSPWAARRRCASPWRSPP
jgi:hypothetical protein